MSRKKKLSRTERERQRDRKAQQEVTDSVEGTIEELLSSTETARSVIHECDERLINADIAMTFATLAHDVWAPRPGLGAKLGSLLAELKDELTRHTAAVDALARRFLPFAAGHHEHLPKDAVDPEEVLHTLYPPRDSLRKAIAGQIPTDSEGH